MAKPEPVMSEAERTKIACGMVRSGLSFSEMIVRMWVGGRFPQGRHSPVHLRPSVPGMPVRVATDGDFMNVSRFSARLLGPQRIRITWQKGERFREWRKKKQFRLREM